MFDETLANRGKNDEGEVASGCLFRNRLRAPLAHQPSPVERQAIDETQGHASRRTVRRGERPRRAHRHDVSARRSGRVEAVIGGLDRLKEISEFGHDVIDGLRGERPGFGASRARRRPHGASFTPETTYQG